MPGVNQLNEVEENRPAVDNEFHVETLLLELRDERQKARRREGIFLSVIAHLCVVILLLLNPKFFHHKSPLQNPQELIYHYHPQHLTFLESPVLTPKPKHKVHSNVLSDRDREVKHQDRVIDSISSAMNGRRPTPQPAQRPGGAPVSRPVNRPPAPTLAGGTNNPNRPQPKPQQNTAKTETAKNQGLHLEDVPQTPPVKSPRIPLGAFSASNVLKNAIQQAARDRMSAGQGITETGQLPQQSGGMQGPGMGSAPGQVGTGVRILTNTQGVDFDPYLRRIVEVVRRNWYAVMPEVARMGRKGRVVIIFNINQNGTVPGLKLVGQSGTESLDQAALAAISASNPFPPLPSEFHGPSITLQFGFFYNMTPGQE